MDEDQNLSWNGPALANEADPEENEHEKDIIFDEDDEEYDKIDVDADDEDEDSEDFDVPLSPSDERLLEELLRMKLTSLPVASGSTSGGAGPESGLPMLAKNRGIFQPRRDHKI